MNPEGDKVEYATQYCIKCNATTEHMTVGAVQKRCRRCGYVVGSTVIRDNLSLEEGEEIMLEVDPADLNEPVLE